ncbi:YbeD family protein [Neisseria sp. Ec49-e6-T10]|uniref:YbeD family protein n=1 Tax=Neisseria sp. Ec49-e6-T10 TaxID=3140744 RepID=UPI003EB9CEB2
MEQKESLLVFPCRFPLKVMGESHPEFSERLLYAVQEHAPQTVAEDVTLKLSSKGNFVSATITITAQSKEQLDNVYLTLTSHPLVKVVF